MKVIIYFILLYLAYRFFLQPAIEGPKDNKSDSSKGAEKEDDIIDIDYEEVD